MVRENKRGGKDQVIRSMCIWSSQERTTRIEGEFKDQQGGLFNKSRLLLLKEGRLRLGSMASLL